MAAAAALKSFRSCDVAASIPIPLAGDLAIGRARIIVPVPAGGRGALAMTERMMIGLLGVLAALSPAGAAMPHPSAAPDKPVTLHQAQVEARIIAPPQRVVEVPPPPARPDSTRRSPMTMSGWTAPPRAVPLFLMTDKNG
ncbi:hypothetical protein ACVWZA_002387 [Sphingomonas sp. UYAg733]